MEKLSVFLSHSHKDIDKIRKIRDVLEVLDCEPLMFYLKCLDDNNETLEDFIKKEIKARNIFVYCRSKNSENSKWVQKELEYIKSLDEKRLYTINIDNLSFGLNELLLKILQFIKKNKIFIYSSKKTIEVTYIEKALNNLGYQVSVCIEDLSDVEFIPAVGNHSHEIAEFQKYKDYILPILGKKKTLIQEKIRSMGQNGIFMPIFHQETTWVTKFLVDNVVDNINFMSKSEQNFHTCKVSLYDNSNNDVLFDNNNIEESIRKIIDFIENIDM